MLATQNPIEQEGTYPLPEAQLDRFMFNILVDYPAEHEEEEILRATTAGRRADPQQVLSREEIRAFQALVRRVPIAETVARHALALVRASRPGDAAAPGFVGEWLAYGASVRAAQQLVLGGKARALTRGNFHVGFEDVRALARPVLRHRILRNFHAESERITADAIVERILEAVPPPTESPS